MSDLPDRLIAFCFLDQAADHINREFPIGERITPRKVAALAKREQWRTRKIYSLRAVCAQDLDNYIREHKRFDNKSTTLLFKQ